MRWKTELAPYLALLVVFGAVLAWTLEGTWTAVLVFAAFAALILITGASQAARPR